MKSAGSGNDADQILSRGSRFSTGLPAVFNLNWYYPVKPFRRNKKRGSRWECYPVSRHTINPAVTLATVLGGWDKAESDSIPAFLEIWPETSILPKPSFS